MSSTMVRLLLVCFALVVIGQMFAGFSHAAIDPGSIVGIWFFEHTGASAVDSSGNGHDGEILGDIGTVEGKFGQALEFPGSIDAFVSIPHVDSLNLSTFSFTGWINMPDPGAGYRCIFSKTADGLLENYCGYLDDGKKIFWGRFTSGGATQWVQDLAGKTDVADEDWHHLAVTYDMKTLNTYVDGTLEIEVQTSKEPDESPGPLTFGIATRQPYTLAGLMDDVGLFNAALTDADIKNIMENGLDRALGITAVSSAGKIATSWGKIKVK